jgi:hypothetical protein
MAFMNVFPLFSLNDGGNGGKRTINNTSATLPQPAAIGDSSLATR